MVRGKFTRENHQNNKDLKNEISYLISHRFVIFKLFFYFSELPDKPELLRELSTKHKFILEVDFNTMLQVVQACQDLQIQRCDTNQYSCPQQNGWIQNGTTSNINMWTLLKGIVPGTKWCGLNDLAENYHDLGTGSYFEVDKCCRAHDHCPVKVHSFSTSYGVTNYHPYTK